MFVRNRMRKKHRAASNMAVGVILSVFLSAFLAPLHPVVAKEGGDGGGSGSSGSSGGSGGDGGGSGGSGSGGSGSGAGGPGASAGSAGGGHGLGPGAPFGVWSPEEKVQSGIGGREAPRTVTRQTEQDRALEAVRLGWIRPLETVLTTVRQSVPGEVLNVGLRHESDGAWIYALTVLTPEGAYRDVTVDARLGQILRVRRR